MAGNKPLPIDKDDVAQLRKQVDDIYEAKDKYAYYLLAVAATAIAYVAHQTSQDALRLDHAILGLAVFCWLVSFYYGCKNRYLHISYLDNSFARSMFGLGVKMEKYANLKKMTPAVEKVVKELAGDMDAAAKQNSADGLEYFPYQFRMLVAGMVFYVIWQVLIMYLKMPPPAKH